MTEGTTKPLLDERQDNKTGTCCPRKAGGCVLILLVGVFILILVLSAHNITKSCPDGYRNQSFIKKEGTSNIITKNNDVTFRQNYDYFFKGNIMKDTTSSKEVASMKCTTVTCMAIPYQDRILTVMEMQGTIRETFSFGNSAVSSSIDEKTYTGKRTTKNSATYIYKDGIQIAIVNDVFGGCGLLPCKNVCLKDNTSYFDSVVTYMISTFMWKNSYDQNLRGTNTSVIELI